MHVSSHRMEFLSSSKRYVAMGLRWQSAKRAKVITAITWSAIRRRSRGDIMNDNERKRRDSYVRLSDGGGRGESVRFLVRTFTYVMRTRTRTPYFTESRAHTSIAPHDFAEFRTRNNSTRLDWHGLKNQSVSRENYWVAATLPLRFVGFSVFESLAFKLTHNNNNIIIILQ